jgi:hypothetical protein
MGDNSADVEVAQTFLSVHRMRAGSLSLWERAGERVFRLLYRPS